LVLLLKVEVLKEGGKTIVPAFLLFFPFFPFPLRGLLTGKGKQGKFQVSLCLVPAAVNFQGLPKGFGGPFKVSIPEQDDPPVIVDPVPQFFPSLLGKVPQ
jgi:hypothetical protein